MNVPFEAIVNPEKRLRAFRDACDWVGHEWGLYSEADDLCPVPAVTSLGIVSQEPVLHELAHVATFPMASPLDSVQMALLFEAVPTTISDRFEIAAWVHTAADRLLGILSRRHWECASSAPSLFWKLG